MNTMRSVTCLLATLWCVAVSGCYEAGDAELTALQQRLLLETAPSAAMSITEAKDSAAATTSVTLIGRIDAGDFDPFDRQVAAFILSEAPTEHERSAGHDVDNCPFCKRRAANAPKAHVVMVDESDESIPHPAPELLGLKRGDQVIVRGQGTWNADLNVLEVKSTGIYLDR